MRAERLMKTNYADSPIVRAVPVGAWRSPVSAPVWGTGGRGFKSRRPDQTNQRFNPHFESLACPGTLLGIESALAKALGMPGF